MQNFIHVCIPLRRESGGSSESLEFLTKKKNTHCFRAGFLYLGTIDTLGWIILGYGGCSVHFEMFNSILSFYQ